MKHLSLTLAGVLMASVATAAPVTFKQAQARAEAHSPQFRKARAAERTASSLTTVTELPELYVVNYGDGFAVLPADDLAAPVLAYSATGQLNLNDSNLRWWLSTYSEAIEQAQKYEIEEVEPVMRPTRAAIAPMVATRWNQGDPYNELCPEQNGKRCVTGCVATAMAQVLKYHNYPAKGTGTHSYTWATGGEKLSFDYGSTTFEWDLMTDTYDSESTAAEKTAVATLMEACGISVDMDYTASESGASSMKIGPSLIDYFGYDRGLWQPQRPYYGLVEWENMIYADLEQGLPVLYCGVGSAGGHQFVCDGYSSDGFFHFNWGWGGLSDGYFQLTALDPPSLGIGGGAGGFNSSQGVVLGVKPAQADSEMTALMYCGGFEPSAASVKLGDAVYFGGGFYNYSVESLPAGTAIGIKQTAEDGAVVYHTATTLSSAMGMLYGYSEIGMRWPTTLKDGTYTLEPAYKLKEGEWQVMRAPLDAVGAVKATVANDTMSFAAENVPDLQITDLRMTSDLYWGSEFTLSFDATNAGSSEYYGTLVPVLISEDGTTKVAQANTEPIDIDPGKSESIDYAGTFSASTTPDAGTYILALVSTETGQVVSNGIEVTLNAAPTTTTLAIEDFQITDSNDDDVTFEMTVSCSEGYYAGTFTIFVFKSSGGYDVASGLTSAVHVGAGESATATATVDISKLEAGDYFAGVYHGSTREANYVSFTKSAQSGLESVSTVEVAAPTYDLQGRLTSAPRHGLYIRSGKVIRL